MLEQVRTVVQLASAVTEIPRQKAEKLARSLSGFSVGGLPTTQVTSLAEEIMKKSQQNAQMIQTLISSEIRRQVKSLGLATRDDVDRINRKVFGLATKDDIDRISKKVADVENRSASTPTATRPKSVASKPKPKPKAKATAKPKSS